MSGLEQRKQVTSENQVPVDLATVAGSGISRGFERLEAFVIQFNADCKPDRQLNAGDIVERFKAADAVNDRMLKALTPGDIEKIAEVSSVVARSLHAEFSKLGSDDRDRPETIPSRLRVQTFSLNELVKQYDPTEVGGNVTAELRKRVKDEINRNPKVIVFNQNGTVDVETSTKLLEDALQGDPDLEQVESDGRIAFTFRIGERPDQVVELHPITREALRSNGVGTDGLDWGKVPMEARQLLYLAVESGEIDDQLSRRDLVYYYEAASSGSALTRLQRELPEAARKFSQLKELDGLPPQRRYRSDFQDNPDTVFRSRRK